MEDLWSRKVLIIREKESIIFNRINEVDKAFKDNGFIVRRMNKEDIKRMLALYFGTSISGEMIEDVEGEEEIMKGVTIDEKSKPSGK